jgi:hypothetical protein
MDENSSDDQDYQRRQVYHVIDKDGDVAGSNYQTNQERLNQDFFNNAQPTMSSAEILYMQYQPSNTTELREYMLFLISKKLRKF